MKLTYTFLAAASAITLAACSGASDAKRGAETGNESGAKEEAGSESVADPAQGPSALLPEVATATYKLEPTHAFLTATVVHNGLSQYQVSFTAIDGTLKFDPEQPENSSLEFMIDPASIWVNFPGDYKASHQDSEFDTWQEALAQDARFMNAGEFPEIYFASTDISRTGDASGTVTGDLSFHGQTNPVTLDVTFNGLANAPWYGERDLIGFDASGTISRSSFGQDALQNMISDEVTVEFSGEFLQVEAQSDGNAAESIDNDSE